MLVDLMLACKPALAVMDAVVGMEGDGPAGGTPRQIGAVMASADPLALDVVASAMAGLEPAEVYTNRAGAKRGLCPESADGVEVVGVPWAQLAPEGFELPARDIGTQFPRWLSGPLRSWTTAKPFLENRGGCIKCRKCEESCPVQAIVVRSDGPTFDYKKCIRCYCCQEMCPPQVIGLKTPPMARLATRRR
jgi:ferredoxin